MTMVGEHYQSQLETFFTTMRDNVNTANVEALAEQHHIPTVFVNEGDKHICANAEEVRKQLNVLLEETVNSVSQGLDFSLLQSIRLSEKIFFVQVKWTWQRKDTEDMVRRITSYTLQEVSPSVFDVVVSVTDENVEAA